MNKDAYIIDGEELTKEQALQFQELEEEMIKNGKLGLSETDMYILKNVLEVLPKTFFDKNIKPEEVNENGIFQALQSYKSQKRPYVPKRNSSQINLTMQTILTKRNPEKQGSMLKTYLQQQRFEKMAKNDKVNQFRRGGKVLATNSQDSSTHILNQVYSILKSEQNVGKTNETLGRLVRSFSQNSIFGHNKQVMSALEESRFDTSKLRNISNKAQREFQEGMTSLKNKLRDRSFFLTAYGHPLKAFQ